MEEAVPGECSEASPSVHPRPEGWRRQKKSGGGDFAGSQQQLQGHRKQALESLARREPQQGGGSEAEGDSCERAREVMARRDSPCRRVRDRSMHFGGSAKKCPDSLCSLCCMMLISSFGVCMCVCALCGVVVRVFLGVMYIYIYAI